MTREELGKFDMKFIRTIAGTSLPDGPLHHLKDGALVPMTNEEKKESYERKRAEVCGLLNDHFALLLSALGLSADGYITCVVYVPGPVILKFKRQDDSVVDVDYYKQLFEVRFRDLL